MQNHPDATLLAEIFGVLFQDEDINKINHVLDVAKALSTPLGQEVARVLTVLVNERSPEFTL